MNDRLSKSADIENVIKYGMRSRDGLFMVTVKDSDRDLSRYGFSVSKRVGNAVVRNRVKRRLREVVRKKVGLIGSWDVVIVALPPAANATFNEIMYSLTSIYKRLGMSFYPIEE